MLKLFARVEDALMALTYVALGLMMTAITIDAIGRYVLRMTLPDVYHFTEMYLMPVTVFMAISGTQRMRGHINVTLLRGVLSARANAAISAVIFLAAALAFAIITRQTWLGAWSHLINWRVTGGVIPWPTGVSRAIVPIGAGVLTIRLLIDCGREATIALGYSEPPTNGTPGTGVTS